MCHNLQTRMLLITDQQIIIETFVTSSLFFILVYEANTYNLLIQTNYFLKQSPVASLQKCVLQICSKFTGGDPHGNVISKKLAWHISMGALL